MNTTVKAATFDEATGQWTLETSENVTVTATYCVMATGCLSAVNTPKFDGLAIFTGSWYHTGNWPHEGVDFTGQRVGVVGTASSGIQVTPLIAKEAEHLFVFQRQANYSVPAHNAPLDPRVQKAIKADYSRLREGAKRMPNGTWWPVNEAKAWEVTAEERQCEYEARWADGGLTFYGVFSDLLKDHESNEAAAEFIRGKIRDAVDDQAVTELLSPRSVLGCKRLCVDTDYYQTFNRANVTLVDISEASFEKITRNGLKVKGEEYELDSIVFAIGFDAMTGALSRIDIRGRSGRMLNEKWSEGPRTYLGISTEGFPNLFTITGPGSPSVLTNMVPSIEQHVDWIADCIGYMREHGLRRIEPTLEAEDEWVLHVNEVAHGTLFPCCNSWYLGVNIPGKPRVFMPYIGGMPAYIDKPDYPRI